MTLTSTWTSLKRDNFDCMTSTSFVFCNDAATTEIYTLSLHDALPIFPAAVVAAQAPHRARERRADESLLGRSEEHTSELQSHSDLVCRLLLEKKKEYIAYLSLT